MSRSSDGWFYSECITVETRIFIDTENISYDNALTINDYLENHPKYSEHEKWKDKAVPFFNIEYDNKRSNELCQKLKGDKSECFEFDLSDTKSYYDASNVANQRIACYRGEQRRFLNEVRILQAKRMKNLVDLELIKLNLQCNTFFVPVTIENNNAVIKNNYSLNNVYPLDIAVSLRSPKLIIYLLNKGAIKSNHYSHLLRFLINEWGCNYISSFPSEWRKNIFILCKDKVRKEAVYKVYMLGCNSEKFSFRMSDINSDMIHRLLADRGFIHFNTKLKEISKIAIEVKHTIKIQLVKLISEKEKYELSKGVVSPNLKRDLFELGFYYLLFHRYDYANGSNEDMIFSVSWGIGCILKEIRKGDMGINYNDKLIELTYKSMNYITNISHAIINPKLNNETSSDNHID